MMSMALSVALFLSLDLSLALAFTLAPASTLRPPSESGPRFSSLLSSALPPSLRPSVSSLPFPFLYIRNKICEQIRTQEQCTH
jgi:hypothetical protein